MPELIFQIRKLERLADSCGVTDKSEEQTPAVDLSKMSPYERQQYKLAEEMQSIRKNIVELDNIGEKASTSRKAEIANKIRRDIGTMKKDAVEAKKAAANEKKRDEYEKLVSHVRKTEQLYKSRFLNMDDADPDNLRSPSSGAGITQLNDQEMDNLSQPMVNLRDDQEFQQFFAQTHQNDQKIDQALDRISAGVEVLHQNATQMGQELKVQKELLNETEKKVDDVHDKLVTLNKRVKKTIKSVQNDKLCMYLICFILLVALAGVVYWQLQRK